MSRSLHEILAAAHSNPDPSGDAPSSSNHGYFGWQVEKRMETPPPTVPTISDTDPTPDRTLRAMQGLPAFPDLPTAEELYEETLPANSPRVPKPVLQEHGEFRSGRREAASRRRFLASCRQRGGRSSQGNGRGKH